MEWDRAAFRYILAPENASAGNELRAEFEEVWQYGSNLDPIANTDLLTSSGCSGGTVQWSTGETGEANTVKPTEDKNYKAWCVANDAILCDAEVTLKVDEKAPDKIECPDFTISCTPFN